MAGFSYIFENWLTDGWSGITSALSSSKGYLKHHRVLLLLSSFSLHFLSLSLLSPFLFLVFPSFSFLSILSLSLPFLLLSFFIFFSSSLPFYSFPFFLSGVGLDLKVLVWSHVFQCLLIDIEVNIDLNMHTYIFYLCSQQGSGRRDTPMTVSTQMLASWYCFTLKESRVPWINVWFLELGQRKWKMRLEHLVVLHEWWTHTKKPTWRSSHWPKLG